MSRPNSLEGEVFQCEDDTNWRPIRSLPCQKETNGPPIISLPYLISDISGMDSLAIKFPSEIGTDIEGIVFGAALGPRASISDMRNKYLPGSSRRLYPEAVKFARTWMPTKVPKETKESATDAPPGFYYLSNIPDKHKNNKADLDALFAIQAAFFLICYQECKIVNSNQKPEDNGERGYEIDPVGIVSHCDIRNKRRLIALALTGKDGSPNSRNYRDVVVFDPILKGGFVYLNSMNRYNYFLYRQSMEPIIGHEVKPVIGG